MPMIHNVDTYITESVPLVLINFSVDDISFLKGEIMGFLQNQSLDISEIRTETSTEPSPLIMKEDNVTEVLEEQGEKKFITSPADIDVHRKVELQDAEVSEVHQNAFKELCDEFKDIFSVDLSNIGKTPLVEMEIDTGDSPPITSVPEQSGQIYEIEPNMMLSEKYPNVYIMPMIHNVDTYITESVPLVLINFSVDDISFLKGEIMGFLQNQSLDISEIRTETSTEPSPLIMKEDNVTEVLQEQGEKKFITSPADIDVHRKVELQDAEVSEEH